MPKEYLWPAAVVAITAIISLCGLAGWAMFLRAHYSEETED